MWRTSQKSEVSQSRWGPSLGVGSVDSRPWDGWRNPPGNTGVSRFLAFCCSIWRCARLLAVTGWVSPTEVTVHGQLKAFPIPGVAVVAPIPVTRFIWSSLGGPILSIPTTTHPRCIHLYYDMYIWSVVCCQVQISSRVALGLTLTILGICSVTLILYMFDTHAHDAVGQSCDEWDSQLIQLEKHGNKIR